MKMLKNCAAPPKILKLRGTRCFNCKIWSEHYLLQVVPLYVWNYFNLCISPERHLPVHPSSLCPGNMKDHQSPFWFWQFHLVKLHHKLGPSHHIWFPLWAYPACRCHHISHLTWQTPEEVLPDHIMDIGMVTCRIWLRIHYKFQWSEIG